MKILVTGGCGFIGSHITDQLIAAGHDVAVVDNLSTGSLNNLNPGAKLYETDIESDELEKVFAQVKPEVVYHEAAQIDIQKSIKLPRFDAGVNISGSINVLENCRRVGVFKLIYASSAAIYGNPAYLGVDEAHPANPISFYGISKYTPEYYIKVYHELYGLRYTILRYANVYGIRQDPKGEGGVVSIFIDKMNKGETPTIFGDGEQTRDFVYVKDIAAANVAALTKADNEIVNIGLGTPVSVNKLVSTMAGAAGKDIQPNYGPERPGDILHSYFNNEKMRTVLDFNPAFDLEKGLGETVAYYKK